MNKISRPALLVLTMLALHSSLYAEELSQSEAQEVATEFFHSHDVEAVNVEELKEAWNSFYVFTPETHKGFVIVSADDSTLPILGYSLTDEMAEGELPCNLRWWCEAMDNEIIQLRESGRVSERKKNQDIKTLATDELYLETPSWNQYAPYYNDCPTYNGSHCLTGCGPTAFSEVMRYHRYPEHGVGKTDAYTSSTYRIYVASRDLEHDYDWDNMPFTYGSGYTDAQATAVATLMADLGALLEADYGTSTTGIYTTTSLISRVYNHYGYSSHMVYTFASPYDDDEWTALMKEQIATYGPVPYTGYSDAGGGHMFVIDGYDSGSYFHINWGWGGSSNGYFLLPSMDYCNRQAGIFNFAPDDGSTPKCTIEIYGDGMSANTTSFNTGEAFTLSVTGIYNGSMIDYYGEFAFVLVDKDDNIKEFVSTTLTREGLQPSYYVRWNDVSCTITGDIEPTDCLRLVYRETGFDEWLLARPFEAGTVYKIHVVASDYDVTMASPGLSTSTSEFYDDISFTATAFPMNASEVTIDNCFFRFVLTDSSGNVKEAISHDFSFSNFSAGTTRSTSDVACSISTSLSAGDRIRLLFQANAINDNGWRVVTTEEDDIPWEVEITEDMIVVRDYTIKMYTPGLSTSATTYAPYVSFTASAYPMNASSYTISRSNFAFALTDSLGNVKELISSTFYTTNFNPNYYVTLADRTCTITQDIEIGDWICMVYQNNHTDANGWKVVEPYSSSTPWRVVITEDNLEPPLEQECSLFLYANGLSVSTDVFYKGVEFTADAYPYNSSGETVTTYMRFALTDSEGEVKEWISRDRLLSEFSAGHYRHISDVVCTISTEPIAGDRIRLFYQGIMDREDTWKLMKPSNNSVPWEVEITQDMIVPTGISSVRTDTDKSDAIYTLQGIRVSDMTHKGVYIVNGKKIYVK